MDHRSEDELHLARVLEQPAHEPVDRQEPRLVLESHGPGDRRLVVPHEPVSAFPGLEMERAAGSGEELLRARERIALASAEESRLLERGTERGLEQPDGMQVSPARRTPP